MKLRIPVTFRIYLSFAGPVNFYAMPDVTL